MTGGKNYCRRCEVYYSNQSKFYPCCGMALSYSPAERKRKRKVGAVDTEQLSFSKMSQFQKNFQL
jgi:hypothetical protein